MAIIHAYFDESGKMGDHPVVTYQALLARAFTFGEPECYFRNG